MQTHHLHGIPIGFIMRRFAEIHFMPPTDSASSPPPANGGASPPLRSKWRSDLWLVAAATLLCFVVSSRLELQESLFRKLGSFESWQADELPFTFTVFGFGLAWYAWRRSSEARLEVKRRRQAEALVGDLLARNRELAQRLIGLQESERLALARELHDELGQSCAAIRADAAYIRHCGPDEHTRVLAAATRVDASAEALYHGVRAMLRRLRPANLDALGLVAALQELCAAWAARNYIRCHFEAVGETQLLDDAAQVAIYRIAQEALTNVARHAQAQTVRMRLDCGAPSPIGGVALQVDDDGHGFAEDERTHGLGLLGAAERAAALGGTLSVESRPGAGVQLRLLLPAPGATAVPAADPGAP